MENKNNRIELNLILEMPETCGKCMCDECSADCAYELKSEAIGPMVNDVVEGFVFLAKNVMGADTASAIAGRLEYPENVDDGVPALDMLYGIFSAAGMKPLAGKISSLRLIGESDTEIYGLFMSMFLDDEEIDWYLVENWFSEELKEVPHEEVQNNCYM